MLFWPKFEHLWVSNQNILNKKIHLFYDVLTIAFLSGLPNNYINGLNEGGINLEETEKYVTFMYLTVFKRDRNIYFLQQPLGHFLLFWTHISQSFYHVIPQYHNGYFDLTHCFAKARSEPERNEDLNIVCLCRI